MHSAESFCIFGGNGRLLRLLTYGKNRGLDKVLAISLC